MPKSVGSCKTCGVRIEYWPSQARTYCSHRCKGIDLAKSGMPTKPRTGIETACGNCGKPVYRMKHRVNKRDFCGIECKNTWQARAQRESVCPQCGATFIQSPSRTGIYCSRRCMGIAKYRRPLDREHNGKPAVLDNLGYVRIFEPGHPSATRSGWIFEHRWVVEQSLGRILDRDENVHHLNHVRDDNRLENLQLLSHSAHSKITGDENGAALREAIAARQKIQEYEARFGPL